MNKIVKIETEQTNPSIDWSNPQYLVSENDMLVYCTGVHSGPTFEGICLSGIENPHVDTDWAKSRFRKLSKGEIVTVQFSND